MSTHAEALAHQVPPDGAAGAHPGANDAAVPRSRSDDPSQEVRRLFALQQDYRWTMARTTPLERITRLEKLRAAIVAHKPQLIAAVNRDFRKHATEFELTEIFVALQDIAHTSSHLEEWLTPRSVKTPTVLFGTRGEIRYEPKGMVAILSPWNYPFLLTISPLVAAIASGNTVILRPSEKTAHTAEAMRAMIQSTFDEREVALVTGGVDVADAILELPFDHFFFTGSPRVGKKVMARAAEHLASVTLELGGKSPVIVDETASIKSAAERVAWGKFLNFGQTCVAPDYVLVHEKVRDRFIEALNAAVSRAYGATEEARKSSMDLARIVDDAAFKRVKGLIEETQAMGARLEFGGQFDAEQRYISPTVLSGVSPSAPIMKEEIFGPVLPVLTWRTQEEALSLIHRLGKPLALYIFSSREKNIEAILANTTSGGAAVNNVMVHLANHDLPFGGVGGSGQGSYHGEAGIRAFSHERSVLRQGMPAGMRLLFPPYTDAKKRLVGLLQRLLT